MAKEDEVFIISVWGQAGRNVVDIARNLNLNMKMSDFQTYCDTPQFFVPMLTSSGEWASIFMSGLKRLAPDIWNAIPDDMGILGLDAVCHIMNMIGIITDQE